MDFSDIVEIKEVWMASAANSYLKDGWTLLAVSPGISDNEPCFLYSLGKREEHSPASS